MKKIRKIVCCCGQGLGSSLILQMNLEKILKELNQNDIEVGHTSLSDYSEYMADVFVIGSDLKNIFKTVPRTIVLKNIVSKEELKKKVQIALEETEDVYCIQ